MRDNAQRDETNPKWGEVSLWSGWLFGQGCGEIILIHESLPQGSGAIRAWAHLMRYKGVETRGLSGRGFFALTL